MANLTDEHRRALQILTGAPDGCTEAEMLTHGFELATLVPRDTLPVMWITLTEAGRKAIAG
jgi:hypothetical protein